ncbi:MAG: hypothetical protein PHU25_09845 [Deltaproteobacteria bacterium]|nr:hypothetical protein [Deltaproteobacteria bacterium]
MSSEHTVMQATKMMSMTVAAILDPGLSKSEMDALWACFFHRCAFCDSRLDRHGHGGRLDRIDRRDRRTAGNAVLACPRCSRERNPRENWHAFLHRLCVDTEVYAQRESRIQAWLTNHPLLPPLSSSAIEELRAQLVAKAVEWARLCGALREAAHAQRQQARTEAGTATTIVADAITGTGESSCMQQSGADPLPGSDACIPARPSGISGRGLAHLRGRTRHDKPIPIL